MGRRSLFWTWLWSHRRSVLTLACCAAVFAVIFGLYGAALEAVAYAAGLCALGGAVALGAGYGRFRREAREREAALASLPARSEPLPAASTPEGEDFRAMAERMRAEYAALAAATDIARREQLDWFTVWVHQIKTPIAVMQMTLQGEDTPEHRAMEAELFRVRRYAEMALTYLRLGEGASDLVIGPCDLDGIIRQAVRKYAPQFVAKRLTLRYEGTQATVISDEKWLAFILEQLLDNAVKYTAAGSVTIAVSPELVLTVADTGTGIAASDLPRIFEKGFTGYNGRSDKSATGLGLYLCRQAADKLRHRLWAWSEPGKGSTFFLDLHRDELEVE